ncbi:Putative RRM domain [Penicillium brasilianum]|uniref:Putative RRM domain n=1 Tax=Penicillium brasilianum TaxID=104259 RepID=A0A0F7TRI7_PENBI|nr:Putative RRM domain [Penicillium brasilianum]
MHPQPTQITTPSGAGPGTNGMVSPFHLEPRTPYAYGYPQGANMPGYGNPGPMPQVMPGMGFQSHRVKFGGKVRAPVPMNINPNMNANMNPNMNANMNANMSPNMNWPNVNGAVYRTSCMGYPNTPYYNGMPQMSSFTPSSVSTPASMYPGITPMVRGNYPWQYMMNCGVPGISLNQVTWTTPDEQQEPNCENSPPMGCLRVQVMKTATGYVAQDMEALTQQEPAIPRAVPAMWTNPSDMSLAKCLENREGITNVYIRGFLPETTDEMLHAYAARFGEIERCKAIVDLETGLCKGFGFVQYRFYSSCENCIRGFYYLGYQASFAQKSRNSRLKELEDRSSTNVYCTNVPIDWSEADLRRHFEPYRVVSEKISRDEETGVSKEVGFARFETREIAETVLAEFHNVTGKNDNVKLLLRFADTKAQKLLKQQSNERRAYRTGEYNYSVEVVQGSTPSPTVRRPRHASAHITPDSQQSFKISPGEISSDWTPATSISPTYALKNKPGNGVPLSALQNTMMYREGFLHRRSMTEISGSSETSRPGSPNLEPRSYMSSPRKENFKAGSMSPIPSRMALTVPTPRSCA